MLTEKKNILIVEDEASISLALTEKLTHEGLFNVTQTTNGKDGLKIALQDHPDLILLDILMPVMDGMTMLKNLRQDPWGKHALVIVLTNLDSDENAIQAFDNLAYDYIIKSQSKIEDVARIVKDKLNKQ